MLLKERTNKPELMDDLTLSGEDLRRNLQELEAINHWLGGHKVVLHALNQLVADRKQPLRPLLIADIGCGGGDMLRAMARWARRKGVAVELTGIDANDFMVQYARQHSTAYPEIKVELHDVFSDRFSRQPYDVIVCSLFCHHFTDAQLVRLFSQLHAQAQVAVIVNDLHRHWLAYYSIKWITALFSRSYLVKNDAPLSVWRAFKRGELHQLLQQANTPNFKLSWMWAFRWQLILRKDSI
ncbi:methyltransferase domain-containing protein [Pontibacter beigongshangensis]|uniref:methyltransferase domain-containing protein n=1 Tax=Pontibacter beigongshangensis TaxID=2574733 RepID=UPI001F513945|nr:methyltransferase domain-containing protein [Pontibacter beigongshangensis]